MRFWILTQRETKALAVLALIALAGAFAWLFLPAAPRPPDSRRLQPLPAPPKKSPSPPGSPPR